MKIRTKLMLLVTGSVALMMVAALSYFVILAPIDQMQAEGALFTKLSQAAATLRSESALLSIKPMEAQLAALNAARKNYDEANKALSQLTLLPQVNEVLKDAVKVSVNLQVLSSQSLDGMGENFNNLIKNMTASNLSPAVLSLQSLFSKDKTSGISEDALASMNYTVFRIVSGIVNMDQVLSTTVSVIDAKTLVVQEEVAKVKQTSTLMALVLVLGIVILVVVISFLMARSIAGSISLIDRTIAVMSSGDFTCRFGLKSKDEIGVLGRNLDGLLLSLNGSLGKIQDASRRNQMLRDELIGTVSESTSSAVEIEANSQSIRAQMERMDAMIADSSTEILRIATTLSQFNLRLSTQNRQVETSVSAVNQMIASIGKISRLTEQDRKTAEGLVQEADRGREVFDHSFDKVAEIAESVDSIREMASVIASLAEQTNILALNAAIEAAHAGEFGKGFAVVSDEIGKLAAASAASSREIDQTIQVVTYKISEAAATRKSTGDAFQSISTHIQQVSESAREINSEVSEIERGSRQILDSMETLKGSSNDLTTEAGGIEQSAQGMQVTLGDIQRVSNEVVSNIGEITLGLQTISTSVRQVSGTADRIGEVAQQMDQSIQVFQTNEQADPV